MIPSTVKATRFPAFFFNGVWQGLKTALVPHACISDPLPPMPTVRDWLQAHGGTGMDADAFDRCESEWYELLELRKRQMNVFLAGLFVGTLVYAIAALATCGARTAPRSNRDVRPTETLHANPWQSLRNQNLSYRKTIGGIPRFKPWGGRQSINIRRILYRSGLLN